MDEKDIYAEEVTKTEEKIKPVKKKKRMTKRLAQKAEDNRKNHIAFIC